LKKLAYDRDIAIIVVHHLRKMGSEDPFDLVSGTMGLTGASDTVLILTKEVRIQADAVLFVSGRDIQENEIAMKFDESCRWQWMGDAQAYRVSKCKRIICNVLQMATEPMTPKQIAEEVKRSVKAVKDDLADLLKEDLVTQESYGKYIIKNKPDTIFIDDSTYSLSEESVKESVRAEKVARNADSADSANSTDSADSADSLTESAFYSKSQQESVLQTDSLRGKNASGINKLQEESAESAESVKHGSFSAKNDTADDNEDWF
jgi:hypothetical protein